jgi:NAD(P)-dependent dehydrogenase (short-subunit alcohol dehydrogenase family)
MSREPQLAGQTIVVIGGSSGIGLETAGRARGEGADVIVTGRDADRVHRAGLELSASIAAFDATDFDRLARFFDALPAPLDHVLVTVPGRLRALRKDGIDDARGDIDAHLSLPLEVARNAVGGVRPSGSLLFVGCIDLHGSAMELGLISVLTPALRAMTGRLALELAPIRVNMIAAGFVDTPLSAAMLGDGLDARRDELRSSLPIRRVVDAADVAALAVHLMTNTAVTGGTFDIDGGQQLVEG